MYDCGGDPKTEAEATLMGSSYAIGTLISGQGEGPVIFILTLLVLALVLVFQVHKVRQESRRGRSLRQKRDLAREKKKLSPDDAILAAASEGDWLLAIKLYRERYGGTAVEAKKVIEDLCSSNGRCDRCGTPLGSYHSKVWDKTMSYCPKCDLKYCAHCELDLPFEPVTNGFTGDIEDRCSRCYGKEVGQKKKLSPDDAILAAASKRDWVLAIKLYRERYGGTIAEAKKFIEDLLS